jgi:L-alanine-DL-glutamate epimerase-like enolase superfamily enzyme
MKITEVTAEKYDLTLKEPFRIALGTITRANNVLVRIFSDEVVGIGEASPTYKITGDNQEGSLSFVKEIAPLLLDTEANVQIVDEILSPFVNMNAAKAAINIAIYDLIGKEASKPLFKLLGGYRKEIETDLTIGVLPPDEVRKRAEKAISEGFEILKIKVEGSVERDWARVEALGDLGVRLRIDANQGFSPKDAVRFIRRLDNFKIELIEQPVPFWDIDGLRYVKENSNIPVFADESVHLARDALKLIKEKCVDGINIKLMKCGGLSEAIRIVSIAEVAGIPCMIGCMLESRVSLTAAAHLALAFRNIRYVDLDSHLFLKDDPVVGGMRIERGRVTLPDAPGLGISEVKGAATVKGKAKKKGEGETEGESEGESERGYG